MSFGETLFIVTALGIFASYLGLLAYGVIVASERPAETPAQREANTASAKLAHQHH